MFLMLQKYFIVFSVGYILPLLLLRLRAEIEQAWRQFQQRKNLVASGQSP